MNGIQQMNAEEAVASQIVTKTSSLTITPISTQSLATPGCCRQQPLDRRRVPFPPSASPRTLQRPPPGPTPSWKTVFNKSENYTSLYSL